MLKGTKNTYKVERKTTPNMDTSWYECMLSPFASFEEACQYIEKYIQLYPKEHQNYKITYQV